MKNIDDFINFLKVDKQDKYYCHNPMILFAENKKGENELNCILDVDTVQKCYLLFLKYFTDKAKRIYLSIDFAPLMDSKTDFILIHKIENGEFNTIAIPYNKLTGEKMKIEKSKKYIKFLDWQFFKFIHLQIKDSRNKKLMDSLKLN